MVSISVQDYLLTIFRLQVDGSPVSTTALAAQLGVTPPSVTGMVHKLHREGLVVYEPYRGTVLTMAGTEQAVCLLRRHRLWELFLTDVLGLPWDQVHAEAHRLEHATSERVAERLAAFLGEPEIDPHGQPIPARDGTLPERPGLPLSEVEAGQQVQVVEVPDSDPAMLQYLGALGLYPGTRVQVLAGGSPGGPLDLWLDGAEHHLAPQVADRIAVAEVPGE